MDLEEILEDCKMQAELMDLFEGKIFSEPKEIKIKKKPKKKHLISVSEKFEEALKVLREQGSFDNSKPITLHEAMEDAFESCRFFLSENEQKAVEKRLKNLSQGFIWD